MSFPFGFVRRPGQTRRRYRNRTRVIPARQTAVLALSIRFEFVSKALRLRCQAIICARQPQQTAAIPHSNRRTPGEPQLARRGIRTCTPERKQESGTWADQTEECEAALRSNCPRVRSAKGRRLNRPMERKVSLQFCPRGHLGEAGVDAGVATT